MNRGWTASGERIGRTLIALLVVLIAFGRPLDDAAHAAALEVEAGNASPLLKLIAAFDVIDDAFDHGTGHAQDTKGQIVLQLALPEPGVTSTTTIVVTRIEHPQRFADSLTSRSLPPLDRPPRA